MGIVLAIGVEMSNKNNEYAIYQAQLEHGSIPEIKKLAEQVYKMPSDNLEIQTEVARYWARQSDELQSFLIRQQRDVEAWQLAGLSKLVDDAFTQVPFYRELYQKEGYELGGIKSFSDFKCLPIVNKKILSGVSESLRVSNASQLLQAHTLRTSGSSGVPFAVFRDDDYLKMDHAQCLRFYSNCLKTPLLESDWIYFIHHSGLLVSSMLGKYRIFQLPDLLPTTPLGQHLLLIKPRLLVVLPSYLPLLIAHKKEILDSGVEAVLVNSESSSCHERAYYSKLLELPIFDEYSSEEIGLMATQCLYSRYHFTEDSTYLEIINADENGFGAVVATDLKNAYMPMIRFDHGDLAKLHDSPSICQCGRSSMSLSEINGRRDDAFKTRDSTLIPSASLLAILDATLVDEDLSLVSYRLIQKTAEAVELLTVYKGQPYLPIAQIINSIEQQLSTLFGCKVTLTHQEVRALPEKKSYKRKSIVNEWSGV